MQKQVKKVLAEAKPSKSLVLVVDLERVEKKWIGIIKESPALAQMSRRPRTRGQLLQSKRAS